MDIGTLRPNTNNLQQILRGLLYGSAWFKSPKYLEKKIGNIVVNTKNKALQSLYFGVRNRFLPLMQYPKKKKGIKANVLCNDRNLLNGKKPASRLIVNVDMIMSFVFSNILLGSA